jgi:hypothetical protein
MFLSWRWMLVALMVFATMDAAAVAMVGSFGLSPGYYMVLLVITRVLIEAVRRGLPIARPIVPPLACLLMFVAAAVFSLWAAVTFFQGDVVVLGGADRFQLTAAAPFQFRRENFTQLTYLIVSVALAAALGIRLSRAGPTELTRMIDHAIVSAMIFSDVLCLWQWLSYNTAFVSWPHDFFFSNSSYASREDQFLLDAVRLSGPFSEPSSLAVAYAGYLFYGYQRFRADGTVTSMGLLLASILIVLLSQSSTGYLLLGLFAAIVLAQPVAQAMMGRLPPVRVTAAGVTAIGLAVAALLAFGWYVMEHKDFVANVLDTLIFKKQEGSSYRERTGSNLIALQILVETRGIGIGIGSHKPSSFMLTLLSNTGVAGTLIFGLFLFLIMKLPGTPVSSGLGARRSIGDPLRWWLFGTLIPLVISGPNLSNAPLWTGFGLELALLGSLALGKRPVPRPRGLAPHWSAPARPPGGATQS